MTYGLACDGCSDTILYLLPPDASDPVKYDIEVARETHRVIGPLHIGQQLAVKVNSADSTVADCVINIDALKGTWCYMLEPQVPGDHFPAVECGMTIKRNNQVTTVSGTMQQQRGGGPKIYADQPRYNMWHIVNGQLILTQPAPNMVSHALSPTDEEKVEPQMQNDTVEIVSLHRDTLTLRFADHEQVYYRKQ